MNQSFWQKMEAFDEKLIGFGGKVSGWAARISLFLVFFWFGILKVFMVSPAYELVAALLEQTMPFIPTVPFVIFLGLAEMTIGILFLVPHLTRLAILFLVLQMVTTFFPLFLLPEIAWQAPFVPTIEGQYILKNIVILSLALGVGVHMKPLHFFKRTREV